MTSQIRRLKAQTRISSQVKTERRAQTRMASHIRRRRPQAIINYGRTISRRQKARLTALDHHHQSRQHQRLHHHRSHHRQTKRLQDASDQAFFFAIKGKSSMVIGIIIVRPKRLQDASDQTILFAMKGKSPMVKRR